MVGMLLLFWSFYPVISFELYSRLFMQSNTLSPVPVVDRTSLLNSTGSTLGSYNMYSNNVRDFTQASLWFPSQGQIVDSGSFNIKDYYLTIPKLNISRAHVVVGGEDLSKSLVHYLPKTMPGEYGNVAIFGHSTLPQLYNEKDYKTIFTYLPSLEKGDKIMVQVGDLQYEYEVSDMYVVNPEKISVLDQSYDASYLTLITCVPPGTYWKRLVVRSKLVRLP
jgi:sortase A